MKLDLSSLQSAIAALSHSIKASDDYAESLPAPLVDTVRSGIIQNFEVAYEQSWKFIRRWIRENDSPETADYPRTRKELFRTVARHGLIADPLPQFEYAEARNLTSHTYNQLKAASGYLLARRFLAHGQELLAALEARND